MRELLGRRRLLIALAGVLLALAALGAAFALTRSDESSPSADDAAGTPTPNSPTPVEEGAAPRGTVVVALAAFQSESFAPNKQNITARPYYQPIFDPLIGLDSNGRPSYDFGLLENVELFEEGRVYDLILKPNLTWQDGVEITADDIQYTMDLMARDPGSSITGLALQANLDRVEVRSKYVARVHLKNQDVTFPTLLAPLEGDISLYPKHYIERVGLDQFDREPLGSGPWRFAGRVLGQHVEYTANEDYWNESRIPRFERLRIVLAPDPTSRKAQLVSGQVDLAPIEPLDSEELTAEGFRIIGPENTANVALNYYRSWDPEHLTNQLAFRQALALAIDMDAIVEAFYPEGTAVRSTGAPLFSPLSVGFNPDLSVYEYDPEAARELLEQVGYGGEPISFYSYIHPCCSELPDVNVAIEDYWRQVGINVELISIEFGSFVELWTNHDFDPPAAVSSGGGPTRPSFIGNMRVYMLGPEDGGLIAGYPEPEKILPAYGDLIATVDEEQRAAKLRELAVEWFDEYWAVPIVWRHTPYALGQRVAGWEPSDGVATWLAFETLVPSTEVE